MSQPLFFICYLAFISAVSSSKLPEVYRLRGEGDYRFATLRWEYPKGPATTLYGFQVHYCELQAWQHNRCRTKLVEGSRGVGEEPTTANLHSYSVSIPGLKMSTNYSFEVRPLEVRRTRYLGGPGPHTIIVLQTKGFSARARLCLPDESEVEVGTGPYFTGRIGVEAAGGGLVEGCSLRGDGNSPNASYTLRIHHRACRSRSNSTSVATFILVQENLPILTHSTRRFLVLCTFHPETLTVRAGLNLPGSGSGISSGSVEAQTSEVDLVPELVGNHVHAMPLQQERFHHSPRSSPDDSEAEVVLTCVAVSVGIVAMALAAWWFVPRKAPFAGGDPILAEEMAESAVDSADDECRQGRLFTISRTVAVSDA